MAQQQQEEGWPLGLQPLRVGRHDLNASPSFNTLLTASSHDFSSDLDTQSTGSFFHEKSMTLGSLIGISSILELSRRSRRGRAPDEAARSRRNYKTRTWFLSLCSRLNTDAVSISNATSLAHLLEAERLASAAAQGPHDFSHISDQNSLFHVAPPQPPFARDLLTHHNAHGPPLLLSCLCAHSSSN